MCDLTNFHLLGERVNHYTPESCPHLLNISSKDPTIFSGITIHAKVKYHLFS